MAAPGPPGGRVMPPPVRQPQYFRDFTVDKENSREDTQVYLDETRHEDELTKNYSELYRTMAREPVLQENSQEAPVGVRPPIAGSESSQDKEQALIRIRFYTIPAMTKYGMAQPILKRLHDSAALTAPTAIGVLLQGQYPNKPHPMLAMSTRDTELQTLHDFTGTDIDISDLDPDQSRRWEAKREVLEQKYFHSQHRQQMAG